MYLPRSQQQTEQDDGNPPQPPPISTCTYPLSKVCCLRGVQSSPPPPPLRGAERLSVWRTSGCGFKLFGSEIWPGLAWSWFLVFGFCLVLSCHMGAVWWLVLVMYSTCWKNFGTFWCDRCMGFSPGLEDDMKM